jgi:hypothetical protein
MPISESTMSTKLESNGQRKRGPSTKDSDLYKPNLKISPLECHDNANTTQYTDGNRNRMLFMYNRTKYNTIQFFNLNRGEIVENETGYARRFANLNLVTSQSSEYRLQTRI